MAAELYVQVWFGQPNSSVNAFLVSRIGWDRGVTLSPFGPRHRKYRKLLNATLNSTAARKRWPLQESGAHKLLLHLAEDPSHFYEHIRESVSETIVLVAFGHECSKESFPYIEMVERAHHAFTVAASPYAYAVDIFPICACFPPLFHGSHSEKSTIAVRYLPEWFPGAKFKRDARIWNEELQELVQYPYRTVKEELVCLLAASSGKHCDPHLFTTRPKARLAHPMSQAMSTPENLLHRKMRRTSCGLRVVYTLEVQIRFELGSIITIN